MEIKNIPLSLVNPSPMNPRKTFDQDGIEELAANIEKQGLLQPITVRPIPQPLDEPFTDQNYEIVCGERRFRAVSLLDEKSDTGKYSTVTAIIRQMTDAEAFDAMITENLQRKDVDPIEEAFAFGELIKTGKSAEEIASRFGKTVRFIQDRIKLNSLIPELMLAVKDGDMPIVAAQIICKLDEEIQRKYYSSYGMTDTKNYTKETAQRFVDNIFMSLDKSLWYDSENQADEEFEGGCYRKCSECPNNTANHGCLFYEMKTEDSGKCTNREKFKDKQIAFILKHISEHSNELVKKGEPLEYGKMVVSIYMDSYERGESLEMKEKLIKLISEMGYETVNPSEVFSHKCYYDEDDERRISALQNNELYRVLSLFSYSLPKIEEQAWHRKKSYVSDDKDEGIVTEVPVEVDKLLRQLKAKRDQYPGSELAASLKTIGTKAKLTSAKPSETEKEVLLLIMLKSLYRVRERFGLSQISPISDDKKVIKEYSDAMNYIMRGYLQSQIRLGNDAVTHHVKDYIRTLGMEWCPEEYQKTIESERKKFRKECDKIISQLNELGYSEDGERLDSESK